MTNAEASDTMVLEIFRSENRLKMSIREGGDAGRTVSHYGLCSVSFSDIQRVLKDITLILSRRHKKDHSDQEGIEGLKVCGQLLWEQLLTRSVREKLKSSKERDLILSLEEELISIPWELLYDGSQFLGLKFNVGRLVRSQDETAPPARYRSIPAKPRMLILANPTGDLKSAYEEGINIRNQFDKARDRVSIDFKSTSIDTFYVKKILRDYDIIHFAGHCEYEKSDPQKTGWLLSDGKFTTFDILSIGADSAVPSLVFSNGCQSARVSKDAVDADYQEKTYSLASAFLFAGVRHYIGSVQRIEDPVSFVFAREFYTRLIRGSAVGEALRMARLRLVEDYGFDSCYWAAYILYGSPEFVLFPGRRKQKDKNPQERFAFWKRHRKKVLSSGLAVVLSAIAVFSAMLAPSINPSSYYYYTKSRRLLKDGKNDQAIAVSLRLIAKDPGYLGIYPLIAESYARLGMKDEALKYYFEYVLQSEKKQDVRHRAYAYITIGWFYQQSGEYSKAFEFYRKAVDLSRSVSDRLHEALGLRKLAVWYMDKGDDDKALELLTKSSEINRQRQSNPEYRYNLACDYFDLGLLFANKEDYVAAKDFYEKSFQAFNALNRKNEISDYYFNLGEICVWEKEYQKALAYYLKGLEIDEIQDNRPNISTDLCMLGELYMEMDNPDKAEEYFKKSLSLAKKIKGRMEIAAASFDLGMLYKKKNQKNLAREYLRQAQEIYHIVGTPDYRTVQQELISLDQ